MKKITWLFLAFFIALCGINNAQKPQAALQNANSIIPFQQDITLPVAYYNTSAFSGESVPGIVSKINKKSAPHFRIPNTGVNYDPNSDAPNELIYDNGPHINMPGAPDLSVVEDLTLNMSSFGGNIQKTTGFSMADDFTLTQAYDITYIDVYTYQTGATPPSIVGAYIQIWDGDPSVGGEVVWGDLDTNILSDVIFEESYRVAESNQSDNSRAIQRVRANTSGLNLDAGTYWVEYTLAGTSSSGPWTPPISILGQTATGNAMQNAIGTWSGWLDSATSAPQGLPFQIYGHLSGPFPSPYCGPISYSSVHPISKVTIAGINNPSDATIDGSSAHEDFTSILGQMQQGESYEISLEGNTGGDFINRFVVYIDWNQNGVLDDEGEVYILEQELKNSNGNDGVKVIGTIQVPEAAILGNTRMRIMKNFEAPASDPCMMDATQGQAEDYSIRVRKSGGSGFPNPYCGPLAFGTVEPITLVEIAGISNRTSAVINETPAHEDFTSISGEMLLGENYQIALEGNTDGDWISRFIIFIDWNQNGILDDAGEVYIIEDELFNSTGTDGIQVIGNIQVPSDAILGSTRMRVKKTFGELYADPCIPGIAWGQAEDYTINVEEDLGISDVNGLAGFSFYPNPSTDIINLSANQKIESVALYNLLGQQVFTSNVGATSSFINVSHLSTGTYVMKVSIDGQVGTYKLLKN